MKKKLLVLFLVITLGGTQKSCTPEMAQWLLWNYSGMNYYIPNNQNWNWWNQGHNNYYYGNFPGGMYNGQIAVPLPNGFQPYQYNYRWNGNQWNGTFWDYSGRSVYRNFQYRNNGIYYY